MSASEPLLDVFATVPSGAADTAPDDAVDGDAGESAPSADWLHRIIEMTGGRDFTRLPLPSVDALLADATSDATAAPGAMRLVAVADLTLADAPLRRTLGTDATVRLAASIAEQGVLEPLLVRPTGGKLEVVAGARRLQAARLAGLSEVPVIVVPLGKRDAAMVALVENLQREDLSVLDEAEAYRRLLDEFGWTQDDLARHIGRSRSHISNTMRLQGLPDAVKTRLDDGSLSAGHARALLNAADPETLAAIVVTKALSVRETEALVRRHRTETALTAAPAPGSDGAAHDLELSLAARLGLRIRVHTSKKGGRMTIYFASPEELDAALRAYGGKADASTVPSDTVIPA